jgi:hypothetical protein
LTNSETELLFRKLKFIKIRQLGEQPISTVDIIPIPTLHANIDVDIITRWIEYRQRFQ